ARARRVPGPACRRRRQPRRHRRACLGRALRSAVQRRRRLRATPAAEAGRAGIAVADSNAPWRRVRAGGGRRRVMMRLSLRAKLTIWYTAALLVVLSVFGAYVLWQ